ncbi:Metaxin-2 [Geodia barretti]|uniref:Metaxin-2 n=1 Tax=Geodia barretti TaxID=519541 RepID=A0AA35XMV5_GEOBA|nr:Metaxin-2 [Geodia barretti]
MAAGQSFSASFSELLATTRGHFAWPSDVILYCLSKGRELLPDKIRRLCFQTYLQLCELPFETKTAHNADAMSPNGLAPFLTVRIGPHLTIFSDFEKLVLFLDAQHLGLEYGGEPTLKADNEAFISLITTRVVPAEVYQTWICPKNVNQVII